MMRLAPPPFDPARALDGMAGDLALLDAALASADMPGLADALHHLARAHGLPRERLRALPREMDRLALPELLELLRALGLRLRAVPG